MGFLDSLPFFRRGQAGAVAEVSPNDVLPEAAVPAATAVAPALDAEPALGATPSQEQRAEAEALVRAVAHELPDFVTIAVLEQAGGHILAGQWAGHSGGAVEAAVANAELVRQVQLLLAALQLDAAEYLEDIVITLQQQLHLMQVLPQQPWLLCLTVRSQDTNLALARTVLRSFAQ